ncbi:hypothetical protein HanRHA438_Chr03g0115451 [Helianthus annuus]|nr:hypothetical protein HanRHA438_Chr03g0115451 [Helianthus annuus]
MGRSDTGATVSSGGGQFQVFVSGSRYQCGISGFPCLIRLFDPIFFVVLVIKLSKLTFKLVLITGECRESWMKIKHRARTEHTLNEASAMLFRRYSKTAN